MGVNTVNTREHSFTIPSVIARCPVLRCANCRTVWWPDRTKPKSKCKGARS